MHSDYPQSSAVADSDLNALGGSTCGQLMNNESVDSVALYLGKPINGQVLPEPFIAALLVEATSYLCPKYVSAVQNWSGQG